MRNYNYSRPPDPIYCLRPVFIGDGRRRRPVFTRDERVSYTGIVPHVTDPRPSLLQFVLSRVRVTSYVCSHLKSKNGYLLLPRTVPDYNLIFVRGGRVVWAIEDVEHEMSAGDLVFVPPGVPHRAFSRTKRVNLGSIHLTATLPGGQDVFELLVPARHRHVDQGSKFDQYLTMAIAEWDRDDDAATMLTMPAWARLVGLELLRYDTAKGSLRQRLLDPLVAEVLDELARRIDRPTSHDELAEWVGYTPQHLNRTFRRVLGATPLQHLTRLRMERAASLLADGTLTVAAIARAVGIDDQYYFSRVFSQFYGRSPTQYRLTVSSNSPS
jgi:AraC family transcriptional regulator of arabinose operon